jgi:Fic family protein
LEGNTLTETETKVILEDGLTIGGKTMREHFEVVGHSQAYDFMWNKAHEELLSEEDICTLHRLFYYRIDQQDAGNYRNVPIFVTGTDFEFPKPSELASLMHDFVQKLPQLKKEYHPIHFAAIAHIRLVTIHPFIDGPPSLELWRIAPAEALAEAGNGRTARLLMNLALLQSGYPITIIPPIMRSAYISAIQKGNKNNVTPFLHFISEIVYESSKEYLRLIKSAV